MCNRGHVHTERLIPHDLFSPGSWVPPLPLQELCSLPKSCGYSAHVEGQGSQSLMSGEDDDTVTGAVRKKEEKQPSLP